MGKGIDGATVAPKERINIKYVPATGGQQAEIELPLTMMVVGNMKGRTEETPIEERQTVSIDKNNFSSVMKESALELKFSVPNGVVAQISQQIMISPAPSDRYTRGFLTGRPRVFSLFIALTYAITSPT
ncbi:type VI secretion system contractile sheath small subunit [Aeromonas salmonicida]|uniref:type VI secretion system contractile sheath small subunit n=3 Tax=Aeromonas salmonicida TaxID=645 RepID=UPI001CECB585|nr:type VI secretion system contractile sheath small subunit [Aeromonas salmonicida]WCH38617.1 type VI secretion system contractile sheath small subunit [Aeromonas salmonicida]WCH50477.1 type VI secretion system contractile sheath small subunit [Aeromonas salmonicida]WGI37441.1 type VI secretion system contractile sheath small subunit [Aeromonas salmonicida]